MGEARAFTVEGRDICLAHCEEGFRAVDDVCSHEDYSLAEGQVDPETCEIECWAHGSLFSLIDGTPQNLPATRPVAVYPVEVEGDDVMVVLP
ncbi:MAG: Rieske (2Fe-2S) protein [Acidimicrobiaceae bacterium]|nr:Rieske (2Fe-2S) protein [Acidimicrobiaceae bacterium]